MRATARDDSDRHWPGINDLLARVQSQQQTAWSDLFSLLDPCLQHLAERLLGPDWPFHSASDLAQCTWANVARAIGQFQGGGDDAATTARLRAWLRQIMTNLHKNERRSAAAQRRIPAEALHLLGAGPDDSTGHLAGNDVPGREPSPSTNLHRHDVRQALERLDPVQREVLHRYFFEQQSLSDIARRLGLKYDEVRREYHNGLEQLRPHLGGLP